MFDPKSENFVHTRVWSTFFISDQKSKLTNFSINIIILVVYPVSTDKMSSVVRSVSFGTIKSSEIVWPQIWKFVHTRVWSTFFISDQKSKLTNFSINLIILVVYPVSTDKMSSVVRSVSFGTIKSSEIVWPQIWKFCPYPGMVDFFHFGPKIQTHKFLYKSNNFGCLPSLNW